MREEHWLDAAWWQSEIDDAVGLAQPVLCNLRITVTHYQLSNALSAILGPGTGANFHTWAVWGSKKAGKTIRQEDIPHVTWLAGALGAGTGALATRPIGHGPRVVLGAAVGGALAAGIAHRLLSDTARRILDGNITVLDDIGRATARFVATFGDRPQADRERLNAFLATLRPGPTAEGGQDLLKLAFTHYYLARQESEQDAKHEHMLLANYAAILHEHVRLQPYISGAMPGPVRRLVTAHLLEFQLGEQEYDVSDDVVPRHGVNFPETLATLENAELVNFLSGEHGWDRTPNELAGSRAGDWSNIADRMNFIVDLFRSRQFDDELFRAPFTDDQRRDVLAGVVPAGPL